MIPTAGEPARTPRAVRSHLTKPLVQVLAAAAVVAGLDAAGLFATTPLWAILTAQLGAAAVYQLVVHLSRSMPDARRMHLRVASRMLLIAQFMYLTGWGAAMCVTFVVVGAEQLEEFGPRSWRAVTGWIAVALAAGQTLVAMGVYPTILAGRQSIGVAVTGMLSVAFVVRHLAQITAQRLQATEEQLRAQQRDAHTRQRFAALVTDTSDVILVVDAQGTVTYATPSVGDLTGVTCDQVVCSDLARLVGDDFAVDWRAALDASRRTRSAGRRDLMLRGRDGQRRVWSVALRDLTGEDAVAGVVVNARDVTAEREWQQRVHHIAYHDALTGIPNRHAFMERLHELGDRRHAGGAAALLFADVDAFKAVNDVYGHAAGDAILTEVARRFRAVVPSGNLVARIAGDEFAAVFTGPDARLAAERARNELAAAMAAQPVAVGDAEEIPITVSVGLAAGSGKECDRLLTLADADMYDVKRRGRRLVSNRTVIGDATCPARRA